MIEFNANEIKNIVFNNTICNRTYFNNVLVFDKTNFHLNITYSISGRTLTIYVAPSTGEYNEFCLKESGQWKAFQKGNLGSENPTVLATYLVSGSTFQKLLEINLRYKELNGNISKQDTYLVNFFCNMT